MIGEIISHYRVLEKLGEGGMGVVFLAEDTRLDRRVALKFLPESLRDDQTARRRFVREAKSAAAIDHPYICKIYEVGEADGAGFIALEYVEGQTLAERLRRGPLPAAEALRLAVEMAEALDKAHRQGIVHRDLKPANVMVTPEGHAKVMDFGLAKRFHSAEVAHDEATLTALTRAGTAPGTLAYMAPEQVRGEEADPRSDVFAFGIVLYEMLTGVHPFRRESANDMLAALLSAEPPTLVRPGVDEVLRAAVGRMLAKDPTARPPGFEAILEELRPLLGRSAATTPSADRVRGVALVLAGVVGVALLGVALVRGPLAERAAPPAAAPDVASLKLEEYQATAESLMQNFGDPETLRMSIDAWEKVRELDPGNARALGGMAMARTLIAWNSRPDPELLERAEREAGEAMRLAPEHPYAYVALTFLYAMQGLPSASDAMSERSVELAPEDPWVLQARARWLIDLYGRFAEAEAMARRATEIDPSFFPAWFQLGWARMELQRHDAAEAAFRRAIELRPDFLAGHLGMGLLLDQAGRSEDAVAAYQVGLELDPDSVQCLQFEGRALYNLGRYEEALANFRKLSERNPGHPLTSYALLYEAVTLARLGRMDERDAPLEAAERRFKANPGLWFNLAGMAGVAAQRGDPAAALAWLRQAVEAGMRSVARLTTDPALEPLYGDSRFEEIVERVRGG